MNNWKEHRLFKWASSLSQSSQSQIERVVRELPGFARKVARHVPFVEDAMAAFQAALDLDVPATKRAMIWAPLLYFVIPVDAVPDFIPGLGFVDDGAAIAAMLAAVGSAIKPAHRARARQMLGLPPKAESDEASPAKDAG